MANKNFLVLTPSIPIFARNKAPNSLHITFDKLLGGS